jgi:hypothetical protein
MNDQPRAPRRSFTPRTRKALEYLQRGLDQYIKSHDRDFGPLEHDDDRASIQRELEAAQNELRQSENP